jgi:hypothetical protein
MTKMFCDCCGKEMVGENRKYDTIIVNLKEAVSPIDGFAIISPTQKPWGFQDVCERCVANAVIGALAVKLRNPKAIITPPPVYKNPFENQELNKAIEKMVEETWRLQGHLERKQFKDALIQAIQSGDFMRFTSVDRTPYVDMQTGGHKQLVTTTYEPFRRVQELERQIELMKRPCDKCGQVMSELSGEDT